MTAALRTWFSPVDMGHTDTPTDVYMGHFTSRRRKLHIKKMLGILNKCYRNSVNQEVENDTL